MATGFVPSTPFVAVNGIAFARAVPLVARDSVGSIVQGSRLLVLQSFSVPVSKGFPGLNVKSLRDWIDGG